MGEKKICTAAEKHKKSSEYGEWFYIQKMKVYHARLGREYEEHREYFSNMALHDSYEEEHVAERLHKQCTGEACLIDKRRIEMREGGIEKQKTSGNL